jgi:gamma-carbonic anhydrase
MDLNQRTSLFLDQAPAIDPTAFVAPGAVLIGAVELAAESSVWFHTVLRADINRISVGPKSNIQDGSVVHLADDFGVQIGELVTCGHKVILHACTVQDEVLIGMGATLLDGVEVGARSIIGANALVTQHVKIPPGSLVLGSPAKIVRQLDMAEQQSIKGWAEKYVALSRIYLQRKGLG